MDKLKEYRKLIKQILTDYDEISQKSPDFNSETCLIFDENHDHYLWMTVDWMNQKRIHYTHVHLRIKNEKIYIEEDCTEEGIANELFNQGIPQEDIVLAFYDPETRKFTNFAIT